MYLNSRPMVAGMRSHLAVVGVDVAAEVAKTRLILSFDPVTAPDGDFNSDMMLRILEAALDQALKDGYKGLWASGDMTWEFGSGQDFGKLMEYEWRLEGLFQRRPELCGICQYHQDTLPREVTRQGLLTHQSIFINHTLSRVNPHYLPATRPGDWMARNSQLDETIMALCRLQNTKF